MSSPLSANTQVTATLTRSSEGASSNDLEFTVQYPPWLTFNCFGVSIESNPLLSGETKTTTFFLKQPQEGLTQPIGRQISLIHPTEHQILFPFTEEELSTRTVLSIAQTGFSILFDPTAKDLQISIDNYIWTVKTANPQRIPPDIFPSAAASTSCFRPFEPSKAAASSSPRLPLDCEFQAPVSSASRTSGPNFGRLSVQEQIQRATDSSLEQNYDQGAAAASAPYAPQHLTEKEQIKRAIALSLGLDSFAAPAAAAAAAATPPYVEYLDCPQSDTLDVRELSEEEQIRLAIAESSGGEEARAAYLTELAQQRNQSRDEFLREIGGSRR